MTTGSLGNRVTDPALPPASALTHDSPAHLQGLRAASTGMRATALVVDAVVVSLITTMCLLPTVIAAQMTSSITIGVAAVFALLGATAVVRFEVMELWRRGQTLGMRVVGISWLRWSLPGRPGLNALAKLVVLLVASSLTLGVGAVIIYLISEDRSGRSWFDRISDIIVVTTKDAGSGEEPSGIGAAGPAVARGGEAVGPQWLALRDEGDGDVTGEGHGYEQLHRREDREDLIETDEYLHVGSVEARRAPDETRSAEVSVPVPGAEGLITEVPWRSGEPEAATAPGQCPIHLEQADSPMAPGGSVPGPEDRWTPQVSYGGEDPLDRTVARPAARRAPSLLLDTGQRIDLTATGTLLLGRDPQAVGPWEGARTFAVDDPGFSISKTHIAVIVDGTGVLVEDLGSTNGTSVETPEGTLTSAGEGQRVRAGLGDVIRIGQRRFMVGR